MSTLTAEGIKALLPKPRTGPQATPAPEPEITTTAAPTANPSQPLLFDPDENVNMDPFGPIQGTGNQVGESAEAPAPATTSPVTTAPPVILEPETTAAPEKSGGSMWLWVGLVACVVAVIIVLVIFATRGGSAAPPPQQSFGGLV